MLILEATKMKSNIFCVCVADKFKHSSKPETDSSDVVMLDEICPDVYKNEANLWTYSI